MYIIEVKFVSVYLMKCYSCVLKQQPENVNVLTLGQVTLNRGCQPVALVIQQQLELQNPDLTEASTADREGYSGRGKKGADNWNVNNY